MDIGYSDFVTLCRIDDPEEHWPWLTIRGDGVYVKEMPSNTLVLSAERAALTQHPTGNLAVPALRFPCDLKTLQEFMEQNGIYGCIDAFDAIGWASDKFSTPLHKREDGNVSPSIAQSEKSARTIERNTLLTIVAGLCKKAEVDWTQRGAPVEIARMTEEIGARVSDDTVRRHLEKIPDALESRSLT